MKRIPVAVLLAGVTGSGKTTLAQELTGRGFLRLSVDEEVFRANGRYGIDYPEDSYVVREETAVDMVRQQAGAALASGRDIVLDHGLWTRPERRSWHNLTLSAGAFPVLVHLRIGYEEALARLELRNLRADANALQVSPEALHDFFARFDAPEPDEGAVPYAGDSDQLIQLINDLRSSRRH
ncbi:MAG: ATP-binding protein [Specibacter sp.]